MMKQEIIKQYEDNRLMRDYDEIELFEEAMNTLFEVPDINNFEIYIQGFHDETEDEEVMFSIVHGIESLIKLNGFENYIHHLLKNLSSLQPHAFEWSETLILRLINLDDSFEILKLKAIDISEENKIILKNIIANLIDRNPKKFKDKGEILLEAMT